MTPEREAYHRWLDRFSVLLPKSALILDVGKTEQHSHRAAFEAAGMKYLTLDRDPAVKPDICMDLENPNSALAPRKADGIIVSGVTEQCRNPFALLAGVTAALKPGGLALWGVACTAFPIYREDYWRFTPTGVARYLEDYAWLDEEATRRGDEVAYMFVLARKK